MSDRAFIGRRLRGSALLYTGLAAAASLLPWAALWGLLRPGAAGEAGALTLLALWGFVAALVFGLVARWCAREEGGHRPVDAWVLPVLLAGVLLALEWRLALAAAVRLALPWAAARAMGGRAAWSAIRAGAGSGDAAGDGPLAGTALSWRTLRAAAGQAEALRRAWELRVGDRMAATVRRADMAILTLTPLLLALYSGARAADLLPATVLFLAAGLLAAPLLAHRRA